jgi:hypothetical protein
MKAKSLKKRKWYQRSGSLRMKTRMKNTTAFFITERRKHSRSCHEGEKQTSTSNSVERGRELIHIFVLSFSMIMVSRKGKRVLPATKQQHSNAARISFARKQREPKTVKEN